jgi:hypothetical protein
MQQMLASTAIHFNTGYALNRLAFVTSIWEIVLVLVYSASCLIQFLFVILHPKDSLYLFRNCAGPISLCYVMCTQVGQVGHLDILTRWLQEIRARWLGFLSCLDLA